MSNTHNDPVIVLIRHPESESNVHLHKHESELESHSIKHIHKLGDPDITPIGKIQADLTAKCLYRKYHNIDMSTNPQNLFPDVEIYYSNCTRTNYIAHESYRLLAEGKKTDIDYRNTISQPMMTRFLQEYTEPKKAENAPYSFIIDHQPADFIGRVYDDFICRQLVKHQGQDNILALYFGHSIYWGLVLSMILVLNQEPDLGKEEIISRFIDSKSGRINIVFQIPNCSITTIRYKSDEKRWKILGFGKNDHLCDFATGIHSVF
jgi:hypothetical protein